MVPKIFKQLLWIIPSMIIILVAIAVFYMSGTQDQTPLVTADSLWKQYEPYITPGDAKVRETSSSVLGLSHDGNLTTADVTAIQDWIARNIALRGTTQLYPNETITYERGSEFSLHCLEMSLLLEESPGTEIFILIGKINYDGEKEDAQPRDHSAVLVIFQEKVFLSDLTIPYEDMDLACRATIPGSTLIDYTTNSYIKYFDVEFAISGRNKGTFKNNEEFVTWMKEKV